MSKKQSITKGISIVVNYQLEKNGDINKLFLSFHPFVRTLDNIIVDSAIREALGENIWRAWV